MHIYDFISKYSDNYIVFQNRIILNKWECTLYVPQDCISAYQDANQWKEFFFMKEDNGVEKSDANGYGAVDVADITALIKMIAGQEWLTAVSISGEETGTFRMGYGFKEL